MLSPLPNVSSSSITSHTCCRLPAYLQTDAGELIGLKALAVGLHYLQRRMSLDCRWRRSSLALDADRRRRVDGHVCCCGWRLQCVDADRVVRPEY